MTQVIPNVAGDENPADELKSRPFTPLKIGADGSRVPYDSPPSFEQLRSELLAGISVVVMNNVDMPALYAKHAREDDVTAYYDNAQSELYDLLESAVSTDPDLANLWLNTWSGDAEGLCLGVTANGEPELAAA